MKQIAFNHTQKQGTLGSTYWSLAFASMINSDREPLRSLG